MKNTETDNRCCLTCIHVEAAILCRDDGMCIPQVFGAKNPRSIHENRPCRFYKEAPKERIRKGPFGITIKEIWDSEKGYYIPT